MKNTLSAHRWFLSVIAILLLSFCAQAAPTTNSWILDGNGVWSDPANWDPASVPNGAGAVVNLTQDTTASIVFITNDISNVTIGTLVLGAPGTTHNYYIVDENGATTVPTGSHTITFDNSGAGVLIDQTLEGPASGDYISGRVVLADNLTVALPNLASGSRYLDIWGVISETGGPKSITCAVGGTGVGGILYLANTANSYSGGTYNLGGNLLCRGGRCLGTGPVWVGDPVGSAVTYLSGSSGTITNAIIVVAGGTGKKYLKNSGTRGSITFSGPITLNDEVEINAGTGTLYVNIPGIISGPGRIIVSGLNFPTQSTNYMALAGDNTFTGGVELRALLRVNHNHALGTGPVGISSGTLSTSMAATTVTNEVSVTNNFTLGQTVGATGLLTLAGPMYLGNFPKTITVHGAKAISGVISAEPGIGFIKSGSGTLTLSAANTYDGFTMVDGGTLNVSSAHVGGGDFSVNTDTATLGVVRDDASPTLVILNSLTTLPGAGATLNCVFPTGPSATIPLIAVNNLTAYGVNRLGIHGGRFTVGQFPLLQYTNLLGGDFDPTPAHLPEGVVGTITNNTADSTVYLLVTSATAADVKWSGALSPVWDFSSLNWSNSASSTTFGQGDSVTLDDTAVGNTSISLEGTLEPAAVVVTNETRNYTLGGAGTLAGSMSLSKDGAGLLTISSANTYTGATLVNAGTLRVNGSLDPASAVIVAGGALGGSGVIGGPVTVQSGGTLAPGGTLTVNNTLTLAADSTTFVRVNASTGGSDLVQGITTANYGGTLVVTNIAGTLTVGQTFTIFGAAAQNSTLASVQSADGGATWEFNSATGVLSVSAVMATTPTNLTYSMTGTTLTLTWPASHQGWYAQSNAVSVADPGGWYDIAGSESGTNLNVLIDPALPQVFYRLRRP
jgi:autotransporter-associated beta strand protein